MIQESSFSVLREYPPCGKYRIRILKREAGTYQKKDGEVAYLPEDGPFLDIREYVNTEFFEGFTRRGIRLDIKGVLLMQEVLSGVISEHSSASELKFCRYITSCKVPGEVPGPQKDDRKEVSVKHCTLCQREIPALGPDTGIGYKEETLCGVCLKSAQRVCPHALRKEDGVTCRDCGARPWSLKRAAFGVGSFVKTVSVGFGKLFMMYTLPSIIATGTVLVGLYFLAKKMGLL